MLEDVLLGIILGVLVQRILSARIGHWWPEAKSWNFSKNRVYRFLHRLYCETCPIRPFCEQYKKRDAK